MANGPGYTVKDLCFWSGFILGTALTHIFLSNLPAYFDVLGQIGILEFARIITLIISVLVGGALGGAAMAVWNNYQAAKKNAPQEDYRRDYHEDRDEHDPRR